MGGLDSQQGALMNAEVFTPSTIMYANQIMLCGVLLYYLGRARQKRRLEWLLIIFYGLAILLSAGGLILPLAAKPVDMGVYQNFCLLAIFIPFIQFVYRFPRDYVDRLAEEKFALLTSVLVAGYGLASAIPTMHWPAITLPPDISTVKMTVAFLINLEGLWIISIVFRQTARLSENPSYSWLQMVFDPQNREGKTARNFGILLVVFLILLILLEVGNIFYAESLHYSFPFLFVWFTFSTAILFFDSVSEEATIMVKLLGFPMTLWGTLAGILGILSPITPKILMWFIVCSLLGLAILAVGFTLIILRPLQQLKNSIAQVDAGDWHIRVKLDTNDEIGYIAQSLNSMIGTVEIAAKALRQSNIALKQKVEEQQALLQELNDAHDHLQSVSRHLVEAQETERRHLAGELHDEVGQALTGIKLTLELGLKKPETLSNTTNEAKQLTTDLIHRVNDLSLNLRPIMLDEFGLLPALMYHFDTYTKQTGIQVDFKQTHLSMGRFPSEVENTAYRIIQEALTNTARYAGVQKVQVTMAVEGIRILIHISDKGVGFDSAKLSKEGFSYGLAGMRERASLLGGYLTVESTPGKGTLIQAELPIPEVEDETA